MASEVPPYQVQPLISSVFSGLPASALQGVQVRCGQALGSEIYVGCSNGELMRFALQVDDPNKPESYTILSRQSLPNDKPVEEIVLIPSIARALVLSDSQIHFYTLPSLDVVPYTVIKPIRHVVTFAVDQKHLMRPAISPSAGPTHRLEPVDFCIVKRNTLSMYSLGGRLFYQKEIPLPQGGSCARRIGRSLCIADKTYYNMLDLESAEIFPMLPLNQDFDSPDLRVEPSILVTGDNEFLLVSWNGTNAMGIFVNTNGEPVRGTLTWPQQPKSICLDHPYITALLPNNTIEIHAIETQNVVQIIPAPSEESAGERSRLVSSLAGYLVPSSQRSAKMRMVPVKIPRGPS